MHVRKRTYKNKLTGERETCCRWQVVFRDHLHQRVSIPAFADKKASEEFGRRIERLVSGRIAGTPLDTELTIWLDSLPGSILARLGKIGLVDSVHLARAKPLSVHVADWRASLAAKAVSKKEIRQKTSRVDRIISGCDFRIFTDITATKVANYLAALRNDGAGISRQTSNHTLGAIKQFTKWMLREGRASQNLLEFMSGQNVRVDRRRVRRALTPDECRRLLSTTAEGPRRRSMSGPERSILYRLALETGLRASELKSLKRADFDLDAKHPTVTIRAAYSKNSREDTLPLKPQTAMMLMRSLFNKLPQAKALGIPESSRTARMLRLDLADAGIPYRDDAGHVADFHALRHTFISSLAASGVNPKTAQTLARHSDIRLTLDRYAHVFSEQQIEAINSLPDLSGDSKAYRA
jgi:integrase